MPPLPARVGAATRSASTITTKRALAASCASEADSTRKAGTKAIEPSRAVRRASACYGDVVGIARDAAAGSRPVVRGLRQRRPPAGGRRLRSSRADELVFGQPLAQEGRLGFWRWASLFLGIAGTYRQNDSVDVVYDVGRQARRRHRPSCHAWTRSGNELSTEMWHQSKGTGHDGSRQPHLILFVVASALAVLAAAVVADVAGLDRLAHVSSQFDARWLVDLPRCRGDRLHRLRARSPQRRACGRRPSALVRAHRSHRARRLRRLRGGPCRRRLRGRLLGASPRGPAPRRGNRSRRRPRGDGVRRARTRSRSALRSLCSSEADITSGCR